ncbi:MAG TPA: hypothetical protein DDW52_04845, partial [Planctomycetaceae bacterium]|nr:hypothetical protein [Planctomycetaceae bacterium]
MTALRRDSEYDCILVGGGLQSGLIALAIHHHCPDASVLMIESGSKLGGNHTWSFHPGDVPDSSRSWIAPLIQYCWRDYGIRLQEFDRTVELEYASITSERFSDEIESLFLRRSSTKRLRQRAAEVVMAGHRDPLHYGSPTSSAELPEISSPDPGWRLLKETRVVEVNNNSVVTECGRSFAGKNVIDCRGPARTSTYAETGYQKFFGFELELHDDWPEKSPIVMDKLDDQSDGFRFMYTLPFERRRVLVEDTRFSDTPILSRDDCLQVVSDYVHNKGIKVSRIVREESGVLPMPFGNSLRPPLSCALTGGYAGGWFHAATGYS